MTNPAIISAIFGTTDPTKARPLAEHMADVLNVKNFGAKGDGSITPAEERAAIQACLDTAFGTESVAHGVGGRNPIVFFPGGEYVIDGPLRVWAVVGGVIQGSGKHVTRIRSTATGTSVFKGSESIAHFMMCDLSLISAGGANSDCLHISWEHAPFPGGTADNCAQITIQNCSFEGVDAANKVAIGGSMGDPGLTPIGGNAQTSEVLWIQCDFINCVWGLQLWHSNALNHCIMGGSFRDCDLCLHENGGAYPFLFGVSFHNNDIDISWQTNFAAYFVGCYSTSVDFFQNPSANDVRLVGCYHDNPTAGTFCNMPHRRTIDCCHSTNGTVSNGSSEPFWTRCYFRGSQFGNPDFLDGFTGTVILPGATSHPGYIIG